jgi:hypothetical protein
MVDCISSWSSGRVRSSLVLMVHFEEFNITPASESVFVRDVLPFALGQRKVTRRGSGR